MSLKNRVVSNTSRFTTLPVNLPSGSSQSVGVYIDNYSTYWLQVDGQGMWVPPATSGWASNFYGSVSSGITITKRPPPGAVQPPNPVDGEVVVAVYDNLVAPSPGYSLDIGQQPVEAAILNSNLVFNNSLQTPDGQWTNQTLGSLKTVQIVVPSYYADASGNESYIYIGQRMVTTLASGFVAVLAGVLTNTGWTTTAGGEQRFFYAQLSADAAGRLDLYHTLWGNLWTNYVAANTPGPMIYFGPNGWNLNGTGAIQVRHSVNCNVAYNFGIGMR